MKPLSRREFLKSSSLCCAGLSVAALIPMQACEGRPDVAAKTGRKIRVGLIGCGSRGTAAAINAAFAGANVQITALADVFDDQLKKCAAYLKSKIGSRFAATEKTMFLGFDAYKQIAASHADLVILATPASFRPAHLETLVLAGKHLFVEKPVAVDMLGVIRARHAFEEAERKRLSVVSGFCYRYDRACREMIRKIHEGALGNILTMQSRYHRGAWGYREKPAAWSDMEWQLRYWPNFLWLSGDETLEILIHNLDLVAWALKEQYPIRATGIGGKQARRAGGVFDHRAMVFEYANGMKLSASCRVIDGRGFEFSNRIFGSEGRADLSAKKITGKTPWKYTGEHNDMYQTQLDALLASIHSGKPINDGKHLVNSTAMGILGRWACYTGLAITWEQLWTSQQNLSPATLRFGALPEEVAAIPGKTVFQ